MKRLPMTLGRSIEWFLGALLPSVFMVPALIIILLPYWGAALVSMFGMHSPTIGQRALSGLAFLLISGWFVFVIGLAVTLWRLTLYGPSQINRSPRMRRFSILALIFLLGLSGFVFYEYFVRFNPFKRPNLFLTFGEVVAIGGVIVVGLRYLRLLLRGAKI